jgi:hypothetical protein
MVSRAVQEESPKHAVQSFEPALQPCWGSVTFQYCFPLKREWDTCRFSEPACVDDRGSESHVLSERVEKLKARSTRLYRKSSAKALGFSHRDEAR